MASASGLIVVVDYGMGNLRSVWQALVRVAAGRDVVVTPDPALVRAAERVVFPGQGSMPDCMRELDARGLRQAVVEAARSKPFLGICIGLQMLFEHSEEGDVAGLGIFPGRVRRFPAEKMLAPNGDKLKVPHMGWNSIEAQREVPVLKGIKKDEFFYFVHSFYCRPAEDVIATKTTYGIDFASSVQKGNLFACQFHPEKSQSAGLKVVQNFIDICK